jgi:hypothetical protein
MTDIMTDVDRQSFKGGLIARGIPEDSGKLLRTWNALTFSFISLVSSLDQALRATTMLVQMNQHSLSSIKMQI